jgi:stage III sporulation protein AB
MIVRFLGAGFIIASCSLLGMHMAKAGSRRTRGLMEFKKSLLLLKSQIDYAIYTLPQAFMNISQRVAPPFNDFYAKVSQDLSEGSADAPTAWEQGLVALEHGKNSHLNKEDIESIALLCFSLGHMDAQVQLNSIDMLIAAIDESLTKLNAENPKNAKMYRSLGGCVGAFNNNRIALATERGLINGHHSGISNSGSGDFGCGAKPSTKRRGARRPSHNDHPSRPNSSPVLDNRTYQRFIRHSARVVPTLITNYELRITGYGRCMICNS